ncbi:MAG TPA: tyrosine recombinase XerC, partial [Bacteroidetes bacterium]|nr:tyrosine recombinase XerC [Bacteroidota bacterium]
MKEVYSKYINQYLSHLKNNKKYSSNTLISYENDLTQFEKFLVTSGFGFEDVDLNVLKSFL